MTQVSIIGQLNWEGHERRSDRYGGIMLLGPHDTQFAKAPNISLEPLRRFVGKRVTITAKVLVTRDSYHVGDLARGIHPRTPKVGWVAELGTGIVRDLEVVGGGLDHLLFQRDGTGRSDWMDPTILYQLHHQTVELTVKATDAAGAKPEKLDNPAAGVTAIIQDVGPSLVDPEKTDLQIKTSGAL